MSMLWERFCIYKAVMIIIFTWRLMFSDGRLRKWYLVLVFCTGYCVPGVGASIPLLTVSVLFVCIQPTSDYGQIGWSVWIFCKGRLHALVRSCSRWILWLKVVLPPHGSGVLGPIQISDYRLCGVLLVSVWVFSGVLAKHASSERVCKYVCVWNVLASQWCWYKLQIHHTYLTRVKYLNKCIFSTQVFISCTQSHRTSRFPATLNTFSAQICYT